MQEQNKETVVVTGVTGFLGSHTAIKLLKQGFNVKGTLRSLKRSSEIEKIILDQVGETQGTLSFVECDLSKDQGWNEAMEGADYAIHTASPFLSYVPKDENEIIKPAIEGTLRVLKAAKNNGIKRVVLTSSIASVLYGNENVQQTEECWTDPNDERVTPYYKSKTLAERAAWDFANETGLELSVINPGIILGPVLESDYGTSAEVIIKLMDKSLPAIPQIGFTVSDVRDVAQAHILAMQSPNAAKERYIAASKFMWMSDIAEVLRKQFPDHKIPSRSLPNWLVKTMSYFDPALKTVVKDLGFKHNMSNAKAKQQLNWSQRPEEETIFDTAQSLIKQGAIKLQK
ncbi:SDR family oxidoreductase [Vibrio sp. RC27]